MIWTTKKMMKITKIGHASCLVNWLFEPTCGKYSVCFYPCPCPKQMRHVVFNGVILTGYEITGARSSGILMGILSITDGQPPIAGSNKVAFSQVDVQLRNEDLRIDTYTGLGDL
ncbi:hypothetical protein M8C21_013177, partial [Ambrosia artemisiifolia]